MYLYLFIYFVQSLIFANSAGRSLGSSLSYQELSPQRAALCWRWWSTAADIDHLSARNCTLLTIFPHATRPGLPAAGVPLSSDCLANSVPQNQQSCFQHAGWQIVTAQQDFFHSVYFSPRWKTFPEITRGNRRIRLSNSRLILHFFGQEKWSSFVHVFSILFAFVSFLFLPQSLYNNNVLLIKAQLAVCTDFQKCC